MRVVHFLGVPGSGKSTTIDLLCQNHPQCRDFYIGRILREEIRRNTPFGQEVQVLLQKGHVLLPDRVIYLFEQELVKHKESNSSVLLVDGFPRSEGQARAYLDRFGNPDLTICLVVPEHIVVERLSARQQSPNARVDDTKAILQKRLETASAQVEPGLNVYRSCHCRVVTIDSSDGIEHVYARVVAVLEEHGIL